MLPSSWNYRTEPGAWWEFGGLEEHWSSKWNQTLISCFKLGFFFFSHKKQIEPTSLVAQIVKNPPEMWEIWVQSMGWQDPLEAGVAAQPTAVFLPEESPWTEEPDKLQFMGSQRVRHN